MLGALFYALGAVCLAAFFAFYVGVFWLVWNHPPWFFLSLFVGVLSSRLATFALERREEREERLRVVREVMES